VARHTIWSSTDRDEILRRFEHLSPDARPKWGTLDAPRMVTHVTDAVRSSLGEVELTPMSGPLAVWPINVLVMFYLPWPKSAPTAPELLQRKPADWAAELDRLRGAVQRFVERDVDGAWTPHAAFGSISGAQWGRLMYRHFDHHLTQFRA
jgi:hypothetical protein